MRALSLTTATGLNFAGEKVSFLGRSLIGIGAGTTAAFAKVVKTFLDVTEAAKKAGRMIGTVSSARAEKLKSELDRVQDVFGLLQFTTGSAVAEPLTGVLKDVSAILFGASKWTAMNEETVQSIAKIGVVAGGIGGLLVALGVALKVVAIAFSGFGAAAGATGAVVAFLATPFGALVAVLAAVGVAIVALRVNWDKALRGMLDTAAAVSGVLSRFLGDLEAEIGVNLGSGALMKLAKDLEDAKKLFPDIGKPPADNNKLDALKKELAGLAKFDTKEAGGSSAGTFSGAGSRLLGVGPGGGKEATEKKQDEANQRLNRIIDLLGKIEQKGGLVFE